MKNIKWAIKKGKKYVRSDIEDYTSSLRKASLFDTKVEALNESEYDEDEKVVKVEVTIKEI